MNKTLITIMFISILSITACSTSQLYHSAKQHQVDQCQKSSSNAEYNDCMERTQETFNEYSKKREETLTE